MIDEYLEVPVSGAQITDADKLAIIKVVLDGWFTEWKVSERFADALKHYVGTRHASLCNSGSSASLLAVTALHNQRRTNDKINKVITCATGFPTTVYPIIQNDLIPLFVDADPHTLNADMDQVMDTLKREDVEGIILAHTLGFLYDAKAIREKCDELGKWFIEDVADALGSEIYGKKTGSFGHASIYSFFPAHQITSGEGGAVLTDDGKLYKLINSYRDWGRDCWCKPGENNTCGKRFGWNYQGLPEGWDHKYTFTNIGYNLKITEMQSALGLSQLERIDEFVETRIKNYQYLHIEIMMDLDAIGHLDSEDYFDCFHLPKEFPGWQERFIKLSPFGFPITVITDKFTRNELVTYLESKGVRTRPVFAGNLVRQPVAQKFQYEQVGLLPGSDYIMNRTFWVGCHPALSQEQLDWTVECFNSFFEMKGLK